MHPFQARKPITVFYFIRMNELIRVSQNEKGHQVVSARELYEFLEVKTQFTKWCERMFEYGFEENKDYSLLSQKRLTAQGNETSFIDYVLTLDTSKEIAMLQRSEKGKQARVYFIECEKKLKEKTPSYLIKDEIERAKAWITEAEERKQLQEKNEVLQFRSDFVDVCFDTDGLFSMEETVKILKLPFGRNEMMKQLREKGVLTTSNTPTQRFVSNGYFKVVESMVENGSFKKLVSTTYATQKGIGHIHKMFAEK